MKQMRKFSGFTLVELLIVIALIAILSVAVLATINPIEQTNKARDASVQNDAAEVMNAYERMYAISQSYPWMEFPKVEDGETKLGADDAAILRSDAPGFGICYANSATAYSDTKNTACNTTGDVGILIENDELKGSFAGKAEFTTVKTNSENGLWLYKATGSGGGVYVCYIPKAKSNRTMTSKLYCLDSTNNVATKAGSNENCKALETTDASWSTPTLDGKAGMFRCVPE